MALATFTRLDAFCALQDPWQFKHLITTVHPIRNSNRYAFLWYLTSLYISTPFFCNVIIQATDLLDGYILRKSALLLLYFFYSYGNDPKHQIMTCAIEIQSAVLYCHINFKVFVRHCCVIEIHSF